VDRWGRWLKRRRPRIAVEQIDAELITCYISSCSSFRAKATVYGTLSTMRGFGDYFVRQGLWKINPLRWMKRRPRSIPVLPQKAVNIELTLEIPDNRGAFRTVLQVRPECRRDTHSPESFAGLRLWFHGRLQRTPVQGSPGCFSFGWSEDVLRKTLPALSSVHPIAGLHGQVRVLAIPIQEGRWPPAEQTLSGLASERKAKNALP